MVLKRNQVKFLIIAARPQPGLYNAKWSGERPHESDRSSLIHCEGLSCCVVSSLIYKSTQGVCVGEHRPTLAFTY